MYGLNRESHMIDILRFPCDGGIDIQQALGNPEKSRSGLLAEAAVSIDTSSLFELDLSFTSGQDSRWNGTHENRESGESSWWFSIASTEKVRMEPRNENFTGMIAIWLSANPGQRANSHWKADI